MHQNWTDELPPNWAIDRVKDVTAKIGSGITPRGGASTYLQDGIPLLRSQNVHFDGLRLDDVAFIDADVHSQMANSQLQERDVVLNITGASIGRCHFIPDGFGQGNVNQHVCILRPSHQVDHRFLYYFLSAPAGQDQVFTSFTGASREGLNFRDLGRFLVSLPKVTEQRRIAAYLDTACAAIDGAIDAKRKQLDTLTDLRKSIIHNAVTRGLDDSVEMKSSGVDWLGEIPAHWDVTRIKRILLRLDYGTSDSSSREGQSPVLKMGHLMDGEIVYSELDYVDDIPPELVLEKGDILYNRTNSPEQVGKAAIFRGRKEDGITFASYLVRLRVNRRADPHFLNYVFNSKCFLGFVRRLAIPSVQQSNLNSTRYSLVFIPLPPKPEQEEIARHLDDICARHSEMCGHLAKQVGLLQGYRKSLIHECVTGKRRIMDADFQKVKAAS